MSNYHVHQEMRKNLHEMYVRIEMLEPRLRNGTAKAVWLEQITDRGFVRNAVNIQAYWLLSDPAHTLDYSDFPIPEAAMLKLAVLGTVDIPGGKRSATPADFQADVPARDRPGLISMFRGAGSDDTLNLGQALNNLRLAIVACRQEARALLPATVATEKRTDVGGATLQEELTIAELGIDGTALADLLVTLKAAILILYQPG